MTYDRQSRKSGQNYFTLVRRGFLWWIKLMPRPLRPIDDGLIYHVINRDNNRQQVFDGEGDYFVSG
jgi:hypothetical protein